ncbi:MAG TPA: DegT/DnrJ/EryC1/StrS family aminotransferase [Candidatus Omnitrophota bacterium]|nr:DegT/DnrJ/EryC1/StrS family aminotransferase [Candidatus Omnitrophota bacterium]HQO57158.1 DegT/DnrJ/EryC1/StrS family aminotransferase [Candidatus Omnitrophota bacterium]
MNVPFVDFSGQYDAIRDEIDVNLKAVFRKGNFILGQEEKQFEEDFARYCGARYAVGVNSGTDALFLALTSLDIGGGDEVILPTHTFIATALCVSYAGATPVFVDVDETTYNMSSASLQKAITKRTKAVIPVHLYGQAADMDEIKAVARVHGITVVEDAAQAHGAVYKGQKVGALADLACFSFYPTKSLGAFGDGGMVVTDNEACYKELLMLRDYGREGRYEHKIKGYNSRLDTVQAVVLAAKLKFLDAWNQRRRTVAGWYQDRLRDVPGVALPQTRPDRTHIFQTFAVRIKNRDAVLEELKKKGVGVLIHYPIPVHLQEAYEDAGYQKGDFPVAERVANEILSLPMFPHMSEEQVEYVCQSLKDAMAG